ncbi:MAG: helix-turn-helix domain-containing protein [Pseudonocardiaceae bacterium]
MITLVYVRQNLNQAAVGDLFEVSQSTVSRVYRGILPLIGQASVLACPGPQGSDPRAAGLG